MKIKCLVTNVTPVGPPNRAERDILRVILDVFQPVKAAIVVGGQLVLSTVVSSASVYRVLYGPVMFMKKGSNT